MLKKIKIEGLFNKFNYEIEFIEGITILTGPNGYGKTTILKIIHAFSAKNMAFFFQLPFTEITLTQENTRITLVKTDHDTLKIQEGNNKPLIIKKDNITNIVRRSLKDSPYRQLDENLWLHRGTGRTYTIEEIISQFNPNILSKEQMPEFVDVYFIKEQRLIKSVTANRINAMHDYEEIREESSTIEEYAKELSQNIKDILANASKIGQELDSSFPRRLFDENSLVSESDFNKRYNIIKDKQKSLSLYGLSATKEDSHTSFKVENAKALLVYLNDTEKKLAVFDDVLQKLEIFSNILNERQFVFKKFEISPDFGFRFKTEDGKELSLMELSSGEQQEVVLLYELLFRVSHDTLVLIDEPEISLHVAWQEAVLNDFLKIVQLKKIRVITATHSPQIIDTHWDLVVDLWDLNTGRKGI